MDLETMQIVHMVAVTGSFSLAAEMIPCSQPTISRRIKMAEDELGVLIFNRHSNFKRAELTTEGRQIVDKFAQITKEYNELLAVIRSKEVSPDLESVTLGIAGNTKITPAGLDLLYSDFFSMYPNATFKIMTDTEENTINLLSLGKINYAVFVRYMWNDTVPFIHYHMDERLRVENLSSNDIFVATGEQERFADKDTITMKELADVPFIYSEAIRNLPTSTIPENHFIFFEACRLAGFTTKITTLHPSRAVRNQAVVAGIGSTHCALPKKLRAYSGVHYMKISDAPIHAEFFLVAEKSTNEQLFNKIFAWLKSYFF